jgi:hypothetical protein
MDTSLYYQYKEKLTESDLITIVRIKGNGLFDSNGWNLLYKRDSQPLSITKAVLDFDSGAIRAVKEQTPEICEYCVLNENFSYLNLVYIKYRTDKIENKILEKVTNLRWPL